MADKRAGIVLISSGHGNERGGAPNPVFQDIIRRTGVRRPSVAYVGAASGDNAAFRMLVSRSLRKAGTGDVVLAPLCGRRGDPRTAMAVLEAADLVFISGGDVEEGMRVLTEKGMIAPLRRLFREGKLFFGVSAGSIMLARKWVRWTDPSDDDSAETFPCLGFAPVLCDTHGEGEGWEELQALLALSPVGSIGYGIVSGSALAIEPDGAIAALGGAVDVFRRRASGVAQVESLAPKARTRRT